MYKSIKEAALADALREASDVEQSDREFKALLRGAAKIVSKPIPKTKRGMVGMSPHIF